MKAEIISVGTELLLGEITDTNAATLARILARNGFSHTHRQTIGDNLLRLTEALDLALSRSDWVFTIGGLGTTQDDLTREGIAAALKEELIEDPKIAQHLKNLFEQKGYQWSDAQLRQAFRPPSGQPIHNPYGTAPALHCKKDTKTIIALPGPPQEFIFLAESEIEKLLQQAQNKLTKKKFFESKTVQICGIGESQVEHRLFPLFATENPTVAPYVKIGEVHLRVMACAESQTQAKKMMQPILDQIEKELGDYIYGYDNTSLEEAIITLLNEKEATLSTAESSTGGLLSGRLTKVNGASKTLLGGLVTYTNETKEKLLGIDSQILLNDGAISEQCARAMAKQVREKLGTTYGISITGLAGPGGASATKPIGLTYIGISTPKETIVKRYEFLGSRENIRIRTVAQALSNFWFCLKS